MTALSNDTAADMEECFGGVLDQLTAAATREEAVRIAARVAGELGGCDGLYLLSKTQDGCFEDLVSAERGERGSHYHTLVVPLHEAGGHAAVGFYWQPGRTADQQSTRRLELLAKIVGLAARMWHMDEEHATQLREERRASAELQHRLRHNLALMRSVIRRSNETAESPEEFALHLDARIGALARTQGIVAAAGIAGVELEELVRTELIASAVPTERYRVEGPAVRLHAQGAQSLGLAMHELATNSLKFGALAADDGCLAVTWTVTAGPEPELQMSWNESGVTIVSLAPRRRGFGQELIECTLPYELGAHTRLGFTPGGVYCTIRMPLQVCAIEFDTPTQHAAGAGRAF
jgi:two-component sensor histidine kinase